MSPFNKSHGMHMAMIDLYFTNTQGRKILTLKIYVLIQEIQAWKEHES